LCGRSPKLRGAKMSTLKKSDAAAIRQSKKCQGRRRHEGAGDIEAEADRTDGNTFGGFLIARVVAIARRNGRGTELRVAETRQNPDRNAVQTGLR
jgi:hypothetical protein